MIVFGRQKCGWGRAFQEKKQSKQSPGANERAHIGNGPSGFVIAENGVSEFS